MLYGDWLLPGIVWPTMVAHARRNGAHVSRQKQHAYGGEGIFPFALLLLLSTAKKSYVIVLSDIPDIVVCRLSFLPSFPLQRRECGGEIHPLDNGCVIGEIDSFKV